MIYHNKVLTFWVFKLQLFFYSLQLFFFFQIMFMLKILMCVILLPIPLDQHEIDLCIF